MTSKRQVSFFIETEIWKDFSKKCIDDGKNKTQVLKELIQRYLKEK